MSGFDTPEGLSPFVCFTTLNWIRLMLRPASRLGPKRAFVTGLQLLLPVRLQGELAITLADTFQSAGNITHVATQRFVALQEFSR